MTLDLTKLYACRNGAAAGATQGPDGRLYGWLRIAPHAIGCAVWLADGKALQEPFSDRDFDLINTPQRHVLDVWVNVYEGRVSSPFESKMRCDAVARVNRTACIHVVQEFTEGEGL